MGAGTISQIPESFTQGLLRGYALIEIARRRKIEREEIERKRNEDAASRAAAEKLKALSTMRELSPENIGESASQEMSLMVPEQPSYGVNLPQGGTYESEPVMPSREISPMERPVYFPSEKPAVEEAKRKALVNLYGINPELGMQMESLPVRTDYMRRMAARPSSAGVEKETTKRRTASSLAAKETNMKFGKDSISFDENGRLILSQTAPKEAYDYYIGRQDAYLKQFNLRPVEEQEDKKNALTPNQQKAFDTLRNNPKNNSYNDDQLLEWVFGNVKD